MQTMSHDLFNFNDNNCNHDSWPSITILLIVGSLGGGRAGRGGGGVSIRYIYTEEL